MTALVKSIELVKSGVVFDAESHTYILGDNPTRNNWHDWPSAFPG